MSKRKGKVTITIEASDVESFKNTGNLLQNIAFTVDEKDLQNLYKKVKADVNFFKKVVKNLDNPIVKKIFG